VGADRIARAVLELVTDTVGFFKGLDDAESKVGAFGKSMTTFGDNTRKVGEAILPFSAAIAGIGYAAISTGVDFEKTMNGIQGVLQPTGAEMDQVRALALKLGADTVFSAKDAAEAILSLGKAGMTTSDAMAATADVLTLAAASGLSMSDAAEMAARTLKMFGLETTDLGHVNDVLAKAVNSSTLEINDLQEAFRYVGPIARGVGMSIEETSAALAIMRDNGIAAETSGRALREGLARLLNPTKKVKEALDELGVSVTDSHGQLLPFDQIIAAIEPHAGNTAAILKIFGQEAGPAMSALIRQGSDSLRNMTTELQQSEGSARAMADAMMHGLPGALEQSKGSIETMLLTLEKALEPTLITVLGLVTRLANWIAQDVMPAFSKLSPEIQTTVVVIGALIAALGPALIAFGAVVAAIGAALPVLATVGTAIAAFVSGPIALIVAAVAGVVIAWRNWDTITAIAQRVYEGVKTWLVDRFNAVVDSIKQKVAAVTGFFGDMYDKVIGHSFVPDMVDGVAQHFGRLDTVMVSPTLTATQAVQFAFRDMTAKVSDHLTSFVSSVLPKFGEGTHSFMSGLMGGLTSMMTGGLNDLINTGLSLAIEGAKRIGQAIAGIFQSEETRKVNKPRDQFIAQFGGDSNLAKQLTDALAELGDPESGQTADQMMRTLYGADTEAKWKSAEQAIASVFSRVGKDVKLFGDGGLVMSPTLGIIGERGPEAVLPLDRLESVINGGRSSQTIIVTLEGRTLTRAVVRGWPRELHLAGVGG
jgi:TP901 family phage tail tape measure protein